MIIDKFLCASIRKRFLTWESAGEQSTEVWYLLLVFFSFPEQSCLSALILYEWLRNSCATPHFFKIAFLKQAVLACFLFQHWLLCHFSKFVVYNLEKNSQNSPDVDTVPWSAWERNVLRVEDFYAYIYIYAFNMHCICFEENGTPKPGGSLYILC